MIGYLIYFYTVSKPRNVLQIRVGYLTNSHPDIQETLELILHTVHNEAALAEKQRQ